jgi:hypothetical protein
LHRRGPDIGFAALLALTALVACSDKEPAASLATGE